MQNQQSTSLCNLTGPNQGLRNLATDGPYDGAAEWTYRPSSNMTFSLSIFHPYRPTWVRIYLDPRAPFWKMLQAVGRLWPGCSRQQGIRAGPDTLRSSSGTGHLRVLRWSESDGT